MERSGTKYLSALALVPLLVGAASAQTSQAGTAAAGAAASGEGFDLDATAGARLGEVSGSSEKFEEYGEVSDGVVLERLRFRAQRPASAYLFELDARDAGRDDESFHVTVGRQGAFRLRLDYDALPHRFTPGLFLFGGFGTGRLLISDVAQVQLQAAEQTAAERGPPATDPNTDTTGEDAIQQGIARGLYADANPVTYRLDRRRVGVAAEFDVLGNARAWVRVRNENRTGARVIGAGTYERWSVGSGLTHTQDRFITSGAELAEPLDHRTLGVSAGAGMHGEAWLAEVEYSFTQFRNFEDVLLWDNPFRATDARQVGGFDRGRFAVGQLVLTPNSLSHDLTASGAMDLPLHGRLAATVSVGVVTQDEAFQPYTRNTDIIATDLAGAPVGSAATAPLPASDLGGEVRTLSGSLSASVRPLQPATVTARYRVHRYDGRSDQITFPGYAAFGESDWRREKNDVTGGLDAPVRNEVFDYWRHEADVGLDYRLTRILSVSLEGAWEAWRFDHARIDKLDELAVGGGFALRPVRNASLKARYRFSDRSVDGYLRGATAENPEARGLLNFNWSDRQRHLADARAQYSMGTVAIGVVGRFSTEDYGGGTEGGTAVDRFRFGRTDVTRWLGGVDVTFTPAERLSVQASYSREHRKEKMANASKDDGGKATDDFGFADNFAPENYWNTDITEAVDTIGVSATVQLIPARLVLDAGYNLSLSDMDLDTSNPSPGVLAPGDPDTMLVNAVANDWPTVKNRLHEVFVDLGYRFSPRVRAGVRYLYESYDLDDFSWDPMSAYLARATVENSTRFVFSDATYNAYQAHVGMAYLSGSF